MGRPRRYESGAERQRAYRQRQEATLLRVERRALEGLHGRLEQLQEAMRGAAGRGDAIARKCGAASVETILEKLIRHFAQSKRGEAIREQNG